MCRFLNREHPLYFSCPTHGTPSLFPLADLVHVGLARKQGPPVQEFGEDAPTGPQVDSAVIRQVRREQQLGATVPAGDDIPAGWGGEVLVKMRMYQGR